MINIFDEIQATEFYIQEDSGIASLAFALECVIQQDTAFSARITENPIEDGSNFSDHVQIDPVSLTINFVVSNYPIDITESLANAGVSAVAGLSNSPLNTIAVSAALLKVRKLMNPEWWERNKNFFQMIKDCWEKKAPLQIVSNLCNHQNMVITNFSVSENKDTDESLNGTITLREIRKVSTEKVKIPEKSIDKSVASSAVSKISSGKKAVQPTNESKGQSWLLQIFD